MNNNFQKIMNILNKYNKQNDLILLLNDYEKNNHFALIDAIILLLDIFNIDKHLRQYINYSNSEEFFIFFLLEFCNYNKIYLNNKQYQNLIEYIKKINILLSNDLLYQNLEQKRKKFS
jgi:hypothetical protein